MTKDDGYEAKRLAALAAYNILDTPAEAEFDELTHLAARLCQTPIALITLLDENRQWFKSKVGLHISQTSKAISFCVHAIKGKQPLIVEDALLDERFAQNPLVKGEPHIRFYAGVPLSVPSGYQLGTLCVIAPTPKQLSSEQLQMLQVLGQQVVRQLALRQANAALLKSEEQLIHSESKFRSLVNMAPVGIFLTDANGRCQFVNSRWQQMTGLSQAEALGDGWGEALHPADRARVWAEWSAATASHREFSSEYRFFNRQQTIVWVTGRAVALQDRSGTITGYLGTVTDISDRKIAETALQQSAALLDVTTDAILVRDQEGRITFWNKGAESLYGWSAEEAIGQLADSLLYAEGHQKDSVIYQSLERVGSWQGERLQITRSGQPITVMSRWTQVKDEQDQSTTVLTVNTDITEAKVLEGQFLRAQRLESIGTLASGIAHDLNNILTPIYGVAQLLPMELPEVDEKVQQQLEILQESAKRGSEIVRQVLSFSRGVQGDRVPVAIKHVIAEIRSLIQKTFSKSIVVSLDIPRDLKMVMGDVTHLHQIFMNFFVNARDAMPNGGQITLSATNLEIDDAFAATHIEAQPGPYILVTVADTGVGIAPDKIDHIFEPFFTTKQAKGGTGLGLSTAHGLVKNHGGFITVYSEVGNGTQFNIYLPAIERQPAIDETEEIPQVGNGEYILVVDDEAPIRQVTCRILENHGYRTLSAKDGTEAIAQYAISQAQSKLVQSKLAQSKLVQSNPDDTRIRLVIMDMMMPGLSSADTVRVLEKIDPNLAVITISGLPNSRTLSTAIGESVKAFVQKPYSAATLLDTIRKVLDL